MENWMIAVLSILGTTIVVLGGVAVYFFMYLKDEKEERNKIINLMSHKYNYRCEGDIIDIKDGPYGRKMILMKPCDLSKEEVLKGEQNKLIKVFFDKSHELTFAKGKLSKGRNYTFILPMHASDLSEDWKSSEFGKWVAFFIEIKNADNAIISAFKEGMKRVTSHIQDIGVGEVSIEKMKNMEEFFEEAMNASIKAKEKQNPISSNLNYNPIR